jgi:hypothetical protein
VTDLYRKIFGVDPEDKMPVGNADESVEKRLARIEQLLKDIAAKP